VIRLYLEDGIGALVVMAMPFNNKVHTVALHDGLEHFLLQVPARVTVLKVRIHLPEP
jgi:hypothetical protein